MNHETTTKMIAEKRILTNQTANGRRMNLVAMMTKGELEVWINNLIMICSEMIPRLDNHPISRELEKNAQSLVKSYINNLKNLEKHYPYPKS
jgi:hypothetical protein